MRGQLPLTSGVLGVWSPHFPIQQAFSKTLLHAGHQAGTMGGKVAIPPSVAQIRI